MRTYLKLILIAIGISAFAMSCKCQTCIKSGENTVQICRDSYDNQDEYEDAVNSYESDGYDCK